MRIGGIGGGSGGGSYASISESGTAVTIGRRLIVNHTMSNGNNNPHAALLVNTMGSGISDGGDGGVQSFHSGSYDCTTTSQQALAMFAQANGARSAGTNPQTNYGLLVSAANGTVNFSIWSGTGSFHHVGDGMFGSLLTLHSIIAGASSDFQVANTGEVSLGAKVQNFAVIPSLGNANIGIGGQYASGCQLTLKNRSAASSVAGMDMGFDTSVNANVWGGVFLWRGANAQFGGSTEAFFAISGGSDMPGAAANDVGVGNWTPGKRLLFYSDGTGFGVTALLNSTGFAARSVRTGGSDVGGSGNGCKWTCGSGSPAGAVTGNMGDRYSDTATGDQYTKTLTNGDTANWRKLAVV